MKRRVIEVMEEKLELFIEGSANRRRRILQGFNRPVG